MPQFRQRYECKVQDYENEHEPKVDRFEGRSIELN